MAIGALLLVSALMALGDRASAQAPDTTPPHLVSVQTNTAGTHIILTFSEDIAASPLVYLAGDLFNSTPPDFLRAIMNVTIDGQRDFLVHAELSGNQLSFQITQPAITSVQQVRISHDNIFAMNYPGLIIDRAGNRLASFGEQEVENRSTIPGGGSPRQGPVLSTDAITLAEGGTTTYTVQLPSQPTGQVTVNVQAIPLTVISAHPGTLTFDEDNWDESQTVTLAARTDDDSFDAWAIVGHTYSDAGIGRSSSFARVVVEDEDAPLSVTGTSTILRTAPGAASAQTQATTYDLTPPQLKSAVVAVTGDSLKLRFSEALDLSDGRLPPATAFALSADGEAVTLTAVRPDPEDEQSIVLIGLNPLIGRQQAVTLSYTDPTSGDDQAAIQDLAGNDARSFIEQAVTNDSTGIATGGSPKQVAEELQPSARAAQQIGQLLAAKARRTAAMRKVSSQLLQPHDGTGVPTDKSTTGTSPDDESSEELILVDIKADVTPELLAQIDALGGAVIDSVPRYRAIRAEIPRSALKRLAAIEAVQFVRPADLAVTKKDDSTEGVTAHQVPSARTTHSVSGAGIGIGVLSNGVRTLGERQASGDLPARVTVLFGQEGEGDEGTAMLEIIHDVAPGAELFFARGFGGQARFAANAEALCAAGADIIVDDVGYFLEAAFQDDIAALGVNAATDIQSGCALRMLAGPAGRPQDQRVRRLSAVVD